MLLWVEFRCARCWTSAANTLGTPLAIPPSPTSENWSDWYWEAYPRYVPLLFDVEQLEHSWILSFFFFYPFITGNEVWTNSYVIILFFPSVCILSICFSPLFFVFCFFFFLLILFLSWMVCWLTGSLFQSAVRKFGRDWGAKVYHQVRWAALTHPGIPQDEGLLVDYYSCSCDSALNSLRMWNRGIFHSEWIHHHSSS